MDKESLCEWVKQRYCFEDVKCIDFEYPDLLEPFSMFRAEDKAGKICVVKVNKVTGVIQFNENGVSKFIEQVKFQKQE